MTTHHSMNILLISRNLFVTRLTTVKVSKGLKIRGFFNIQWLFTNLINICETGLQNIECILNPEWRISIIHLIIRFIISFLIFLTTRITWIILWKRTVWIVTGQFFKKLDSVSILGVFIFVFAFRSNCFLLIFRMFRIHLAWLGWYLLYCLWEKHCAFILLIIRFIL
jgi:hypothetical protein